MKFTPLLATPPTVTTTLPVVAAAGTFTVTLVALQDDALPADAPLKVTVLVPWLAPKFVPVMVTAVPIGPEVLLRLVIVGPVPPLPAPDGLNAAKSAPQTSEELRDAVADAVPGATCIWSSASSFVFGAAGTRSSVA